MIHSVSRRHLGFLAAAVLLESRRGRAAAPEPRATLIVGDQKGGAHSLMRAAGVLDDVPYDIRWAQFAGAPMLLQAMNANAVEIGAMGDAPLAFALAGGSRIKAVAAEQTDGVSTAVIVRKDSPIHDIASLRGKTIATLRGQTGHYLVLAALKQVGLSASDVKFVFIPPVAAKAALQSGAVDSWATWGPYISEAKIADGCRELVNGRHLMSGLAYITATPGAIAAKHTAIADFIARSGRAQRWAKANLDAYARIWSAEIGFSEIVARDVVEHLHADLLPIDAHIVAAQQGVCDFMHENGLLPERLDAAAGFDRSFS